MDYEVIWDGCRDDQGREYLCAAERQAETTGRTWSPPSDDLARLLPERSSLAPVEHGKFRITASGLTVVGVPTYEECAELGGVIAVFAHGLPFIIGDFLNLIEDRFNETAAQIIDAREWAPETVRVYRYLAARVPPANRMLDRGLSVKHHQIVAALPVPEQKAWLDRALGNGDGIPWTTGRLTDAVRAGGDVPPSRYFALVEFSSEAKRDEVVKRLELDGLTVRPVDSRKRIG